VPAVSRRRFDYSVPERWQQAIRPGARVRVPFHGRRVGAWVVDVDVTPPDDVEVRELTGVSGWGPPQRVLELARWGAWRWAMPVATLLRTASPNRNVWALPSPSRRAATERTPAARVPLDPGVSLHRLAPSVDLLPLVLDVVAAAEPSGRSTLVLAPSTGWAARLADRLRTRGVDVACDWAQAAAGWPVVVGSRAAAWAPVPVLGAAVVLDAHDYRDRYDAADVVAERARRDDAPCVLVSACPTAVQRVDYGPVVVPERSAERSGWPAVTVVDRRGDDPRTGLFSEQFVRLARTVLDAGGRLVCVLNRTGRARLLACAACGSLARCAVCGRAVESTGDVLRCRGCGAERPVVCAECGSARMKVLRQGVGRVREELEALLSVPVGEVSGRPAGSPDEADAHGGVPDTAVLVGTEAVLHRVRHAAAVVFLDFDQHLLAPRFVAGEEALALLVRAGRLVGARDRGIVMVQTRIPDHDVVRAAVAGDPGIFTELELRAELRLPPYSALATVKSEAMPVLDGAGVEVSPLEPGRWLVRAADHRALADAVAPLHGGVNVDPVDV
jgi:primosomal protein N' (replication factor Y)